MLAGVIYAFCFFKILHGGGHLQIVWSFWLPMAILLLAWWFERPRLDDQPRAGRGHHTAGALVLVHRRA